VVVDRDAVTGDHVHDPVADRAHDSGRLVPEHGGEPGGDVPVGYVGGADAAGEHVAHDFSLSGEGILDLLDADVAGAE
jgi:hypothetical protein